MLNNRLLAPRSKGLIPIILKALMFFSIMCCNCQGVLPNIFKRTFKSDVQIYNPLMVAHFEPRTSGIKAEKFIL